MGTRSTHTSERRGRPAARVSRHGVLLAAAALPLVATTGAGAQSTPTGRVAGARREARSDLATVNAGSSDRGIVVGNTAVYAFGRSQPVVTCTVLRACIVELEAGETVVDEPIAGDQVRWHISASRAGPAGATVLVVVKPQFCDITTNLVVPTDRRIYDLTLDSPPCTGGSRYNPQQAYVRHVRFTYDGTRRLDSATPTASSNAPLTRTLGDGVAKVPRDSAATVNRDYRIVRSRRGLFGLFTRRPIDFPWRPVAVFDDGAHLTIELPAVARHQAAPALYALEDDGSRTIMNYSARWDAAGTGRYVTDRVARRVVLVQRSGRREQKLELENRSYTAPRPAPASPAQLIPGYTGRVP